MTNIKAYAPGRVNLIGDHTDYTGGLVLPMAIDRGTTIEGRREGNRVILRSGSEPESIDLPIDVTEVDTIQPAWGRYVAGVIQQLKPAVGFIGTVETDLPIGAGLSSSAALEVAVSLALGFEGSPVENALLCQRAEQVASGVPCGVMDQLTSVSGKAGKALLIDCHSLSISDVEVPHGYEVVVRHSGAPRTLAGSAYAERRAQCEAAERFIGPLRKANLQAVSEITDETLRKRAQHVVSENKRVRDFAEALKTGDVIGAGKMMNESHESLRDDFEVSIPAVDELVATLQKTPGVLGARMTGGGFGGCVVAIVESSATLEGWRFRPSAGALLF